MSNRVRIAELDIIFLSYDEPNAEKNYADLCSKIPWAKRVHGVHGSDAAHKACAEISDTERLIIVDGDNIIDENFVNQDFVIDDSVDMSRTVISYTAKNIINGLVYGNGGIKSWPKDLIRNMKTHENAAPDNLHAQVDFCWDVNYFHMPGCYSEIHNNATPHQAWRAGFREGVKMALKEGVKVTKEEVTKLHWKNLHRLYIWLMAGADVENGLWAIYGSRLGLYKTVCTDWDFVHVRDFKYLNNLWSDIKETNKSEEDLLEEIQDLGHRLKEELDIPIDGKPLSPGQSEFFKFVYTNPPRSSSKNISNKISLTNKSEKKTNLPRESYDIVFISYNEPNAEQNWQALKSRFPKAKRVDGVEGVHNAHIEAAKLCDTDMIWIVDADAVIKDNFYFDYVVSEHEKEFVHVWRSENAVKGLEYGYGGVKLLPRVATLNMDISKPDMTTSISRHFKPVKEVSNTTVFNTDAFNAWKSGFRECAKLSSKIIDRQKDVETELRLNIWCSNKGNDKPFGEYVTKGAREGRDYGISNRKDITALKKINDFEWLKEQFNARNP
jgi:hypothetical protein